MLKNIKNKKNEIKPSGFIIARNKIYLSLNNGRVIKTDVTTGIEENIYKLSGSKLLRPKIFGKNLKHICMSSTRSSTGHLLGASGSIEAIFSILALRDDLAPPTLNLDNPSDNCKGINLIPKEAIQNENKYVLSNSFGFGGTNVSLIFKKI